MKELINLSNYIPQLKSRFILETYVYGLDLERKLHIEQMDKDGWKVYYNGINDQSASIDDYYTVIYKKQIN